MKIIYFFTFTIGFAGCAQLQQEVVDQTNALSADCRKYPTSYSSGGNNYTCSWNSGSLQFVCVGGGNTVTYKYPSLEKFVEEIKVYARIFMTSITSVGSSNSTTTMTYDNSGRLTTWVTVTGATTLTYSYTSYDAAGRPQSGLYNISSGGFTCTNATITRTYNDAVRTMNESISGGVGALCSASSVTSTYDKETGVDIVVVATPGGTTTKTINSTAQVCK
jgi:YD repeat-containing protein